MKCLRPRLAPAPQPGGWKPDEHRGNRHQRGYGTEWEKTRERILLRDHGLCQPCLKRDHITLGNQVDHIVSKAEARSIGWTEAQIEADANLQAICDPCHRTKTSSESRQGAS